MGNYRLERGLFLIVGTITFLPYSSMNNMSKNSEKFCCILSLFLLDNTKHALHLSENGSELRLTAHVICLRNCTGSFIQILIFLFYHHKVMILLLHGEYYCLYSPSREECFHRVETF